MKSQSSRILGIKVELVPPSKLELMLNPLAQARYKFSMDQETPAATKAVVYTAAGALVVGAAWAGVSWLKDWLD